MSVAAGSLDAPAGLSLARRIGTEAGDCCTIDAALSRPAGNPVSEPWRLPPRDPEA